MKLFSKSASKDPRPSKLVYSLPQQLRVQIVQIWQRGFGPDERYHPGPGTAYEEIHRILCEHHQMFQLPQISHQSLSHGGIIAEYFVYLEDTLRALDVLQVVLGTMEKMLHRASDGSGDMFYKSPYDSSEIIAEVNKCLQENNVGYKYTQGRIEKVQEGSEPMPLKERLVAGEPARNLRKIKDMIGGATVAAIHDPYTTAESLVTILKLADMGTTFSPALRVLGTGKTFSKSTEKAAFIGLLNDINTERKASWAARVYPVASRPHRRFLMLDDGSVVTCGMSLNHIDKDEVLDHEPPGSENARHDKQLFEQQWNAATPI